MDAGAIIAWPERFNHDEASAIQHAMNLKLQDEAAFFAEYQNEPLPETLADDDLLTADQIAAKINGMHRGDIAIGGNHLTMFVDVQQNVLFYVVAAWEDDFTGYVIDYGTYPDQQRAYFTLRDARHTLAAVSKGAGVEGAIYAGLEALTAKYLGRHWRRDDGAELRIERCLIDANWGSSTDVVYQFCRQSAHAGIVIPSHGRFVGASSFPFSEYKRKPGRPRRAELADPQRPGQAGRAARDVRHELLEVVRPRPAGRADGRPGLSVALRQAAPMPTACSPNTSRPSTASRPRGVGGRWTNGSQSRTRPITIGLIVWWGLPSQAASKGRRCLTDRLFERRPRASPPT